jgi:light-harvesting protein B-800-850 alpha chain
MAYGDDNAGIWLVVKPTIGLPIFLIAVAVTALIVHWALLVDSGWYAAYHQGHFKKASMEVTAPFLG